MKQRDQKLALQHFEMVSIIAKQMRHSVPPRIDLEDMIAEGVIGLLHAVARFDPGRGVLFKTFAERRIRGAIIDAMRRDDWVSREARAERRACDNEALGDGSGGPAQPATPTVEALPLDGAGVVDGDCAGIEDRPQEHRATRAVMASMPMTAMERRVVFAYYWEDLLFSQIAAREGCSESRISQSHASWLSKLTERLEPSIRADGLGALA